MYLLLISLRVPLLTFCFYVLCFDVDVVLVCTEPFTVVSLEGTMEEMSGGSEDN